MAIIFTAPIPETGFAGDMDMRLPNAGPTVVEGTLMNDVANVAGDMNVANVGPTVVEGTLMNDVANVAGVIVPNGDNT